MNKYCFTNRVSFGSKYESDKDASNSFLIPVSPFLLFGVATRFACGYRRYYAGTFWLNRCRLAFVVDSIVDCRFSY
jgi:hypothetical protein